MCTLLQYVWRLVEQFAYLEFWLLWFQVWEESDSSDDDDDEDGAAGGDDSGEPTAFTTFVICW